MRRHSFLLAALVAVTAFSNGATASRAQTQPRPAQVQPVPSTTSPSTTSVEPGSAAAPAARPVKAPLPLAPQIKGHRPRSNPSVLPPAATELPPGNQMLRAPANLALPNQPSQVRITDLRPLGLSEVETILEVNNPNLKALAEQVKQAQSFLRAQIALWYPTIDLTANNFPSYAAGSQYRTGTTPRVAGSVVNGGPDVAPIPRRIVGTNTTTSIWAMEAALRVNWALIDPTRTPQIAAARDQFEKSKNAYLIGLRDLRLQAAQRYFDLQQADDQVRIGQQSVRASLISLRDARARFRAGVATKLEVLEAETQLARDQQLLTTALFGGSINGTGVPGQAIARRSLATLLDLPQNVTPTAKDPSRVVGTWLPSLQESIIAAYAFREELDQILLDISVANSDANTELGRVQPFLSIVNSFGVGHSYGFRAERAEPLNGQSWNVDNSIGMSLSWNLFDGGRARALYRRQKQVAEQGRYRFASQRDSIREEVEDSFYSLDTNNRNIATTSREVISTRESLRLARLRFQAGVTTQREVVDSQRDLTQAEVRYANAVSDYNKRLAELRRRTGLDQIALCPPPNLPASPSRVEQDYQIPVEPQPVQPACNAAGQLPDADSPRKL